MSSASTTTNATGNQATFARLDEAINSGDLGLIAKTIDDVVDPDLVFHTPVPLNVSGVQAFKQVWEVLLRAFPDLHVAVEDIVSEGDKVVYRNTVTGTHRGEYRGIPPTGKSITYNEIFIIRFANARIAEIWGVVDVFAQMRQLGVIPPGPLMKTGADRR